MHKDNMHAFLDALEMSKKDEIRFHISLRVRALTVYTVYVDLNTHEHKCSAKSDFCILLIYLSFPTLNGCAVITIEDVPFPIFFHSTNFRMSHV